jgi:hypothetical protein
MNMIDPAPIEAEDLVEQLLACSDDPLAFVNLAFPEITLEKWQRAVLETIGNSLRENARLGRCRPIQIAVASGNTVGKTALLSFIILWSLATFENTLGVVTAGTEPQIRTRLWGELSKWFVQLPDDLRSQFELTATAIFNRQNERTWRIDGRPWSERNQEAFSGLHNFGKRVLVIFDECSMIAEPIWRACDGMLNDAETEIIWCVFGNPLRLDGRFPMCFPGGRFAGLWKSFRVDSRTVSIANQESLAEKISYYGEDSNYVRSHIRGLFPTASTEQLIPADWVEMAAVRETFADPRDATIIGADVASGHGEDSSCIVVRRGLDARSYPIQRYANLDPLQFAYKIAATANEVSADAVFIDSGGLGEGTVAKCRELGLAVHAVYFAGKPDNPSGIARAGNKRSQMYLALREWLKAGAIPNDSTLKAELIAPEYEEGPLGILIERKSDMRARGLASPDSADALALTFAAPVFSQMSELPGPGNHLVVSEYNPYSDSVMRGEEILPEMKRRYTAPGWSSLKPEWNHPDWTGDDWADAAASDALRIWQEPPD